VVEPESLTVGLAGTDVIDGGTADRRTTSCLADSKRPAGGDSGCFMTG
jgi:hypothetical protein